MDTPYSLTVLDEVVSTQDEARTRATPNHPAVVIAHRQTGGRGRSGTRWETAPRAVAISYGWIDQSLLHRRLPVPLVAAVAARRALGPSVKLKWPNDVLLGEDKLGGILVEASGDGVVAGLGVNLHWPAPPPGVAALEPEDPGEALGLDLGRRWAEELHSLLQSKDWPLDEYVAACATIGRSISWDPDGRGQAVGVEADGRLRVETPEGEVGLLASGAIRHLRHN